MKVACLVVAYRAAPVLAGMLPILRDAGWDVYVHLDPKRTREEYSSELGDAAGLCVFVDNPVEIYWGGYSMMRAEFKLLEAAQEADTYDKFVLLSDDSFPILPAAALAEHFSSDQDQISLVRLNSDSPLCRRYSRFYLLDHPATTYRRRGQLEDFLEIDVELEERLREISFLRGLGKKKIDFYFGRQFWALTKSTINFVTDKIRDDWHLQKSFEYSALPDESMIQSILGNYVVKNNLRQGHVYMRFPMGNGPALISNFSDLPFTIEKRFAFLRKIAPNATPLLEMMEARLSDGKTIFGLDPADRATRALSYDEKGRSWVTVRLTAPFTDSEGWHGLEREGGRSYRWTALNEVTWKIEEDIDNATFVRFLIPLAMPSQPGFAENTSLEWSGQQTKPALTANGLIAEFERSPARRAETTDYNVTLRTPNPLSPYQIRGAPDRRPLGLCVLQ